MDERGGSFVAVRRISQSLDRGNTCHSTSAEVVAGSAAWLGRGLSCVCAQRRESDPRPSFDLTPAQEECLQRLQNRMDVAYDGSIPEHQEALRALWNVAFPEEELHGLISEQWKEMGWQGKDPSTDFRGGGFISLENLLFFAKNFPRECDQPCLFVFQKSFQDLLRKQEGDRSVWEYPFAVAGVNITFMLIQMLDLEAGLYFFFDLPSNSVYYRPILSTAHVLNSKLPLSEIEIRKCSNLDIALLFNFYSQTTNTGGSNFLEVSFRIFFASVLTENESAFDLLYCITFKLMDHQWLEMRASYMDFNTVMKSTRRQLERELLLDDITRLEELPSYSLLS
ncbi:hypothetical protein Pint_00084 [Pistacia integerrima]|uniref:Uncharacterized protein n=1 Tax=Pistacia integerrima TaxID=434235 RepID=A0ACC0ZPV4_9ROSI|nr:hypothetical protein Pint_00084 [Pistacia integerrima]